MKLSQIFYKVFSALFLLTCSFALTEADTYEIKEISNIPYYENELSESEDARLNLLIPQGVEKPPVFVWIGQGAWAYVNREVEMNLCRQFAKRGILVVSAGHRLSPALLWEPHRKEGVQHPAHVKDIAQSLKWLKENCDEYGFSIDSLFVGGYSSEAHLSALVAMDNRYLAELGLSNKMITGIIPVAGGYDIPDYRKQLLVEDSSFDENHIIPVFGDHENQVDASPINYIENLITPILLISEGDTYTYSASFENQLVESGFEDFQVINAHNETHASLWRQLGSSEKSIYRDHIVHFITSRSKKSDQSEAE